MILLKKHDVYTNVLVEYVGGRSYPSFLFCIFLQIFRILSVKTPGKKPRRVKRLPTPSLDEESTLSVPFDESPFV